MNSNDRSSFRDEELQPTEAKTSMKKSVDEFLNELDQTPPKKDAWSKIADELNSDESGNSDWNANETKAASKKIETQTLPQTSESTEADGIFWDGDDANNVSDNSTRQVPYRNQQDGNKFEEDYETRSRNRTHSVWNRGEWSSDRDGYPGRNDRYSERRGDRRGNYGYSHDRNYGDYQDDGRGGSFRQDYRTFNRPNGGRPNSRERGYEQGASDDRRRGPNDGISYRDGGYYPRRDGGQRPDMRRDGGYRQNGYRNEDRRSTGDRRDYRREPNDYQNYDGAPNGYRPQSEDYRQNGRRDYRNYGGRDDYAASNWRRNDYGGGYYGDQRRRPRYNRRENLEPTIGALGKRGEPLSLAEELAARRYKRSNVDKAELSNVDSNNAAVQTPGSNGEGLEGSTAAQKVNVSYGDRTPLEIVELEKMTMQELVAEARRQNIETIEGERRRDLTVRVLRARLQRNGMMFGEGTLEILPDEFGFLRSPKSRYISCPDDIYISPSQIRRFGLRNGLTISGQIRPPKERERYFALLRVESINGEDPNVLTTKPYFDDLVVARPTEQLKCEVSASSEEIVAQLENLEGQSAVPQENIKLTLANLRAFDLVAPLAFGQRALLVCPPHSGKRALIRGLAKSAIENNPDVFVFVLLIDERPEEITEMERRLQGVRCEVISSTFDESPMRHIQASEIAFEKAKRMVEYGQDVIVIVNSFTNIAKAWNAERSASEVAFENTVDPISIQRPKKLFSSARCIDGGGSLTVIGAIRYEEANAFDQMTYEELKMVANAEIWLDRALVDAGAEITIDATKSRARDVKDFVTEDKYSQIVALQQKLSEFDVQGATAFLAQKFTETNSNSELFESLDVSK